MRINCDHGYYSFFPEKREDLALFLELFSIELVFNRDHYTYSLLKDLPKYVISPTPYGGFLTTKCFEGTPQEIMKEFDLVYDISKGILVPTQSITYSGRIKTIQRNWISETAMIQAGTIIGTGRIVNFDGIFDFDLRKTVLRYWNE